MKSVLGAILLGLGGGIVGGITALIVGLNPATTISIGKDGILSSEQLNLLEKHTLGIGTAS